MIADDAKRVPKEKMNSFAAEAMFVIASVIHLGKSGLPKTPITEDDLDRFVSFSSRSIRFN